MPMYILIEYSDNYTDSSGSLYQFKRDESPMNDAGNHLNVALENSTSFKYKANLLEKATDDGGNNRSLKNAEIVVPLKYLSNFFRSLEIPNNRETIFKITSKELYVPIVVLSTKDDVNLTKQLNEGFKRSVYWNEYKSKIKTINLDNNNTTRFPLDASFQGVNRFLVLAFDKTNNDDKKAERDSHRKCFLPRVDITNYNVLIDGRNFYGQPINDQIKKYDEIKEIATGKGDDYTTVYLLDYQYIKDH